MNSLQTGTVTNYKQIIFATSGNLIREINKTCHQNVIKKDYNQIVYQIKDMLNDAWLKTDLFVHKNNIIVNYDKQEINIKKLNHRYRSREETVARSSTRSSNSMLIENHISEPHWSISNSNLRNTSTSVKFYIKFKLARSIFACMRYA